MTLRGVIQSLLHGSGDAEAMLADNGYSDLPPEMFGQALASYADTAPMDEADALTPVLGALDEGNQSDVFAVLESQPLAVGGEGGVGLAGLTAAGAEVALDESDLDIGDDFGTAAPLDDLDDLDNMADDASEIVEIDTADGELLNLDDPLSATESLPEAVDSVGEFEALEDFFDREPSATNEDLDDLDF